jgi:hypothetical protein
MNIIYKIGVDIVTETQQTVQCEVLTDSGQTVEDSSGHTDRDPTDGTV